MPSAVAAVVVVAVAVAVADDDASWAPAVLPPRRRLQSKWKSCAESPVWRVGTAASAVAGQQSLMAVEDRCQGSRRLAWHRSILHVRLPQMPAPHAIEILPVLPEPQASGCKACCCSGPDARPY